MKKYLAGNGSVYSISKRSYADKRLVCPKQPQLFTKLGNSNDLTCYE